MAFRQLDKPEWQSFCDRFSKASLANPSAKAIAWLAVNKEVVAAWMPLLGISYDPKKDDLEINLRDLDHWVRQPLTICVDFGTGAAADLEIIDAAGLRQSLALSQPLSVTLAPA